MNGSPRPWERAGRCAARCGLLALLVHLAGCGTEAIKVSEAAITDRPDARVTGWTADEDSRLVFSPEDEAVVIKLRFDFNYRAVYEWYTIEWVAPDGSPYQVVSRRTEFGSHRDLTASLDVRGKMASRMPGLWRVRVWLQGRDDAPDRLLAARLFRILTPEEAGVEGALTRVDAPAPDRPRPLASGAPALAAAPPARPASADASAADPAAPGSGAGVAAADVAGPPPGSAGAGDGEGSLQAPALPPGMLLPPGVGPAALAGLWPSAQQPDVETPASPGPQAAASAGAAVQATADATGETSASAAPAPAAAATSAAAATPAGGPAPGAGVPVAGGTVPGTAATPGDGAAPAVAPAPAGGAVPGTAATPDAGVVRSGDATPGGAAAPRGAPPAGTGAAPAPGRPDRVPALRAEAGIASISIEARPAPAQPGRRPWYERFEGCPPLYYPPGPGCVEEAPEE